jgi:hypothetical protein
VRALRITGLLLALVGLGAGQAQAAAPARIVGPAGVVLPQSPAGLSVETDVLNTWWKLGTCRSPAREALRMAGRPEIRIGGNSQDRLWPTAPLPQGQRQVADAAFFHAVRCVGATGSPVLLGLNLLGRDPQAAGDILAAAGGLVPRGRLTIAVGNEPNLYGNRLPDPGGYAGYGALYGQFLGDLRARFGSFLPPIAGPDAATWRWIPETAQYIGDWHPAQADVHLYGLNGCRQLPGYVAYPTIGQLLDPAASTQLVRNVEPALQAARAAGIPAVLSETNSVACRGVHGVSDAYPSALWALGLLGDATTAGFRRLQFHTSIGFYDAFMVTPQGTVIFRPLWTAIVLADALWPEGTRPLRVVGPLQQGLGAWAARRPDRSIAVLVVNRDLVRSRRLVLRTAARRGELGRVTARGAFSIALNGRQLVWTRGRPRWRGRQRVDRARLRGGRLRLTLAPGTAAWLVLDPRPGEPTPATLTAGPHALPRGAAARQRQS